MTLPVTTIKPGELYVSNEPCRIKTLLGSCVSVTVHNTEKGFGGMNHFMLPETIPSRSRGPKDFRFGDRSIRWMLDRMLEYDSDPEHLDVKLFGGGRVVSALSAAEIGSKNVSVALKVLGEYGLEPSKRLVSQESGLKLDFNTSTNLVKVRRIRRSEGELESETREELRDNQNRVAEIRSGDEDGDELDFLTDQ